jgi:hypothetical protein
LVEPPLNLVHNILAQTSMQGVDVPAAGEARKHSWRERMSEAFGGVVAPLWGTVRQPRFGMSFGMALFSISLLLNVSGIKLQSLAKADLRPAAVVENARMSYYETSARVVKYYENLRLVYELESKVRELKRVATPVEGEQEQQPEQQRPQKNEKKPEGGLTEQERKQNQNYSRERTSVVLAEFHPPSSKIERRKMAIGFIPQASAAVEAELNRSQA